MVGGEGCSPSTLRKSNRVYIHVIDLLIVYLYATFDSKAENTKDG